MSEGNHEMNSNQFGQYRDFNPELRGYGSSVMNFDWCYALSIQKLYHRRTSQSAGAGIRASMFNRWKSLLWELGKSRKCMSQAKSSGKLTLWTSPVFRELFFFSPRSFHWSRCCNQFTREMYDSITAYFIGVYCVLIQWNWLLTTSLIAYKMPMFFLMWR